MGTDLNGPEDPEFRKRPGRSTNSEISWIERRKREPRAGKQSSLNQHEAAEETLASRSAEHDAVKQERGGGCADADASDEFFAPVPMPAPGARLLLSVASPSDANDHVLRARGPDPKRAGVLLRLRRQALDAKRAKRPAAKRRTASSATFDAYLKRASEIAKQYRAERQVSGAEELDPVDFAFWSFSLKRRLASSAWRAYRNAIKALVSRSPHDKIGEALSLAELDVQSQSYEGRALQPARRGHREPTPRGHYFYEADFEDMISACREGVGRANRDALHDWLLAGATTGLAPSEWALVDLEVQVQHDAGGRRRGVWLHVLRLIEHQESEWAVRTLDLSACSDDAVRAVQGMTDRAHEWLENGAFDHQKGEITQQCLDLSCRLFPRMRSVYSLFSVRHQFIANMARVHRDPSIVASLLGHWIPEASLEPDYTGEYAWETRHIEPVLAEPRRIARVRQILEWARKRDEFALGQRRRPRGAGNVRHD